MNAKTIFNAMAWSAAGGGAAVLVYSICSSEQVTQITTAGDWGVLVVSCLLAGLTAFVGGLKAKSGASSSTPSDNGQAH